MSRFNASLLRWRAHTHTNAHRGTTGRTAGATTPKMAAVVTPNDADNIISILLTSHMAKFPSPDAAIRPLGRHLSALRPLYDTSSPVTQTRRSRMANNPVFQELHGCAQQVVGSAPSCTEILKKPHEIITPLHTTITVFTNMALCFRNRY